MRSPLHYLRRIIRKSRLTARSTKKPASQIVASHFKKNVADIANAKASLETKQKKYSVLYDRAVKSYSDSLPEDAQKLLTDYHNLSDGEQVSAKGRALHMTIFEILSKLPPNHPSFGRNRVVARLDRRANSEKARLKARISASANLSSELRYKLMENANKYSLRMLGLYNGPRRVRVMKILRAISKLEQQGVDSRVERQLYSGQVKSLASAVGRTRASFILKTRFRLIADVLDQLAAEAHGKDISVYKREISEESKKIDKMIKLLTKSKR